MAITVAVTVYSQHQSSHLIERLQHRQIDHTSVRLAQTLVARVSDDSDDLISQHFRSTFKANLPTDWISVAEVERAAASLSTATFGPV